MLTIGSSLSGTVITSFCAASAAGAGISLISVLSLFSTASTSMSPTITTA